MIFLVHHRVSRISSGNLSFDGKRALAEGGGGLRRRVPLFLAEPNEPRLARASKGASLARLAGFKKLHEECFLSKHEMSR